MNALTKLITTLRWVARHPLCRHAPVRAMARFCVAQVAARALPCDVCVAFPNDTRLLVPPRMKGAAHFIYPGLSEFEDMTFVMHYLRPEDVFFDIGANVGAFTVLANGVAGAKVTAYEPCPATYNVLTQNIRLNGLTDKVTARNVALGGKRGKLHFTEDLGTENYIISGAGSSDVRSTEVEVSTLDDETADKSPSIIKIDVEGYETEVFSGGRRTLSDKSLMVVIAERVGNGQRYGFDEEKLHAEIRAQGFLPSTYKPFDRSLERMRESDSGNIIYVRDLNQANDRVRGAKRIRMGSLSV